MGTFIIRCEMCDFKIKIRSQHFKIYFGQLLSRIENRLFENSFNFLQFKIRRRNGLFKNLVYQKDCNAYEKEKRDYFH